MTDRHYLTTPIYYVNDAPHLGHAYTTVIADALARWYRLAGAEVKLLTGTDEHGLKVARAAAEHGVNPREWADRTVVRFTDAWRQLDISNDDFIRTTEPRHVHAATHFLQTVYDNGYIRLGEYAGSYCVSCEAYYTDADLVDGACPIHRRPVELVTEQNYFFRLSEFGDRLLDHYARHPDFVRPAARRNEAIGFIKQGLEDFSISRTSLDWGIPLPWDQRHVTYVWFDALTNYLTAIGYPDAGYERWWPAVHHIIGKDIVRFHCVYWPAMLLAAGLEPPARVSAHGFLLLGGEKMAKSRLGAVAPADLIAEFGVDGLRYHLLRDVPFGPDGEFSYEGLLARYNTDLANGLGNLLARVVKLVQRRCGGTAPPPRPDSELRAAAASVADEAAQAWAAGQPSVALAATWRLVRQTNAHLEAAEPWKALPGPAGDAVLGDALEALRIVAILAQPAVPDAAAEVWRRIGLVGTPEQARVPADLDWAGHPGGVPVVAGPSLFPRLG